MSDFPTDRREKERLFLREFNTITVCAACLRASCWTTAQFCEDYQTAGTKTISIEEARKLGREDPNAWVELRRQEGYTI